MDREGLASAFASLCTNVALVYRWFLGGMCPPPVDIGTDRSAIAMAPRQPQRRSVTTMTDADQTRQGPVSTVDQVVLVRPYDFHVGPMPPPPRQPPPQNPKNTHNASRMPMLQTWERGQKYQRQLQDKIKTWQALAAKQRVFKATPLPKLYTYNARRTSKGDVAASGSRRALQDEKKKIDAEKKQLSADMLLLLNAMAKAQTHVALAQQVPLERS